MRRLGRFQRKAVRYRVSPGGDAAMEANMAGTRRASGWRRAGRRGADGPPWSGRACSGWGPRHLVWVQEDDLLCLALSWCSVLLGASLLMGLALG